MEDGLRELVASAKEEIKEVLILVLMEDGLRDLYCLPFTVVVCRCLNPCFNGRWSASSERKAQKANKKAVLILVLMEDGLRGSGNFQVAYFIVGLNPCFNGRWSARKWQKR